MRKAKPTVHNPRQFSHGFGYSRGHRKKGRPPHLACFPSQSHGTSCRCGLKRSHAIESSCRSNASPLTGRLTQREIGICSGAVKIRNSHFKAVQSPRVELLVLHDVLSDGVHAIFLAPLQHPSHHRRGFWHVVPMPPACISHGTCTANTERPAHKTKRSSDRQTYDTKTETLVPRRHPEGNINVVI